MRNIITGHILVTNVKRWDHVGMRNKYISINKELIQLKIAQYIPCWHLQIIDNIYCFRKHVGFLYVLSLLQYAKSTWNWPWNGFIWKW